MICAAESINCIILFIHITFFNTSVMFHVELSTLFNNEHQTIIMSTDNTMIQNNQLLMEKSVS